MCLGLATGYREPTENKERTYADLKQTHFPENKIDAELTNDDFLKALEYVKEYEQAIKEEQDFLKNGDEFHVEALRVCEVVKQALLKQIPKKPRTQFDRIKAMNVKKLAKLLIYANDGDFIVGVCDERNCKECDDKNSTCSGNCIQAVIKWLESEVEEE